MELCSTSDKKVSPSDTLAQLIGKLIIATRGHDGSTFSARLKELRGSGNDQEIWLESKTGIVWMIRRSSLSGIREVRRH
jgi:hypothetical protein